MTANKSAFDLVESTDADVIRGAEAVLELDYPCPDCGHNGMRAEVVGCRAICWCPTCESEGDDFPTYGVHDVLGQFVIEEGYDFSLRDVPAERATLLENE
jgi:hypothetical protein